MKFALVFPCLPHPSSNGWGIISWVITKSLLDAGHAVQVYSLLTEDDLLNAVQRQAALLGLGIEPVMVPVKGYGLPVMYSGGRSLKKVLHRFFRPGIAVFFPNIALAPSMGRLLEQAAPDAVLAFHYDALAVTHGFKFAPRLALTADIWHWPRFYSWRTRKPRLSPSYIFQTLETLGNRVYVPRFMVKLVKDCESSMCFGAYDAAWLRGHGVRNCQALRAPIEDAATPSWEGRRRNNLPRRKPRILVGLSNLGAIATRTAVRFFAVEILPRLERELGLDGFEVNVIGEGDPPPELTKILPRPSVILRGRIEPADSEFLSADIVLIPTPIVLGLRNRIICAFSFGCCVIAHTNEAFNLPEMVNEKNALLASNGRGLTEAIVRAIRNPDLRKQLGVNAPRTYERYFIPGIAAAPIVSELERLAREWKGKQSP